MPHKNPFHWKAFLKRGWLLFFLFHVSAKAQDNEGFFSVYQVYQNIPLGTASENSGQKNYYLNLGKAQGIEVGDLVEVYRRIPMVHNLERRYYQDLSFPFAQLKIIHTQWSASIGKLDKFLPEEETPTIAYPKAIMVGDEVRMLKRSPQASVALRPPEATSSSPGVKATLSSKTKQLP